VASTAFAQLDQIRAGGSIGWTLPAALRVGGPDAAREILALSGDYDFRFLIEELERSSSYLTSASS
jgi:glyoxylate carboligase